MAVAWRTDNITLPRVNGRLCEQPIDIPAVISKLIDTFSTIEPFIEELARGTKRECAEVHDGVEKAKIE